MAETDTPASTDTLKIVPGSVLESAGDPAIPPAPEISPREVGDRLASDGGRILQPLAGEIISQPVTASTKYDTVISDMDTSQEIARIGSFRDNGTIMVYADSLDPSMLDRPEVKRVAYDHRLHYGLGEAGMEIYGGPYRIRPEDSTEKPALYEKDNGKGIWRRLFKINTSY